MLFHPYHPLTLFGRWRVGFFQGAIPKNQPRLAAAIGKTVGEAYDTQVDSDRYEHGHSGYTGTLAEKDGYVLIKRPTRITAGRLMDTIIDAEQWAFWVGTPEKYRHAYAKPKARCRHAWERLDKWFPEAKQASDILDRFRLPGDGAPIWK